MRSSISIDDSLYEEYKELKKEYGYTMTELLELGIKRAYKGLQAKKKFAKETGTIIGFMCRKQNPIILPIKPMRGHYKVIFIKNIEKIKLNKVKVYFHDYEFTESRRRHKTKNFLIDRIDSEILKHFC